MLEAARLLSREKFPTTIVYAVLSGEEQGLWGGQLLARTAKQRGWQVAGVLNNDIVGNTHGIGGEHIDDTVRVFSEGIRAAASRDEDKADRGIGGEDDFAVAVARQGGRARRGADPRPQGVRRPPPRPLPARRRPPAVPRRRLPRGPHHRGDRELRPPAPGYRTENGRRFGDVIEFVDFPYLAKVAALNVATLRELANAPAAPAGVTIAGAVSDDTTVAWKRPRRDRLPHPLAARRRTAWTDARYFPGGATSLRLDHVNIDDHFFGVAALNGAAESVVTFAGVVPRPPPGATR